jgi:hypothetical protein
VRLRSPLLSDKTLAWSIKDALLEIDGVARAEVNLRTGGLLLEYDREKLPAGRLIKTLPVFEAIQRLTDLCPQDRPGKLEKLLSELKETLDGNC